VIEAAAENPSTAPEPRRRDTNFDPERKLHIPENAIPGYVLYFFRGEPGRLSSALRKGWEWVTPEEVSEFIATSGVGADPLESGATDMGGKVSVPAQEGVGPDGQYLRLYLMKLKKEYWDADMEKYIENRIQPIVDAFASGMVGAENDVTVDRNKRYVKKGELPEMFKRKTPKHQPT